MFGDVLASFASVVFGKVPGEVPSSSTPMRILVTDCASAFEMGSVNRILHEPYCHARRKPLRHKDSIVTVSMTILQSSKP